jgi:hypothetical protein
MSDPSTREDGRGGAAGRGSGASGRARDNRRAPILRIIHRGGVTDDIALARVALPGLDIQLPRWPAVGAGALHDWERGQYRVEDPARAGRHAELSWSRSDQAPQLAAAEGLRAVTGAEPERTFSFALEDVPGAGAVGSAGGAAVAAASFRCPSDPRLLSLVIRVPGATLRDLRELSARVLATAICVGDPRSPR